MGRILAANQKSFLTNNVMRVHQMFRLATSGFKAVFQSVPYLLQVNLPGVPGYVRSDRGGLGVSGFGRSAFARLFKEAYPNKDLRDILVQRPLIQSLSLIGSPGSVGHTSLSDLDYWVCIDQSLMMPGDQAFIADKMSGITEWAATRHGVEVHFFVMDLEDIRANRLGTMDDDNAGNVMPSWLKEEYYRTMVHVAGRLPLWWGTPVNTVPDEYQTLAAGMDHLAVTVFSTLEFVDLGFPARPGPRECLGAAMWQAHKSQKDPFKAVLKMILIKEQVDSGLTASLVCDQVKEAVFSSSPDNFPVDPYLLTIRRVLACAGDNPELVRISAWFKLVESGVEYRPAGRDLKGDVLAALTREWGWSKDKIRDLQNYQSWPERRKLELGEQIKALLLDFYSDIAARLRLDYPEEVLVHDENLTRLNVEILAKYADYHLKVEDLPSAFHRRGLPRDLILAYSQNQWRVYDSGGAETDFIYASERVGRVAAWLVHNHVWHSNLRLRIKSGIQPLELNHFQNLAQLLHEVFPPLPFTASSGQSLISRPQGPRVLIINLEEPESHGRLIKAEKVYRTNLGEMCYEILSWPAQASEADKYRLIAQSLVTADDPGLQQVVVFVPENPDGEELEMNLRAFFRSFKATPTGQRAGPQSKARLDLD